MRKTGKRKMKQSGNEWIGCSKGTRDLKIVFLTFILKHNLQCTTLILCKVKKSRKGRRESFQMAINAKERWRLRQLNTKSHPPSPLRADSARDWVYEELKQGFQQPTGKNLKKEKKKICDKIPPTCLNRSQHKYFPLKGIIGFSF